MSNNSIILFNNQPLIVPDQDFANVISLMDMESLSDVVGNTPYLLGSASLSTSNPKYGTKALNNPASSGLTIEPKSGVSFDPLGQDFTWEIHVLRNTATVGTIFGNYRHRIGYRGGARLDVQANGTLAFSISSTLSYSSAAGVLPTGNWKHVAVSRVGNNWYVSVEGSMVLTFTDSSSIPVVGNTNTLGSGTVDHYNDFRVGYFPSDAAFAYVLDGKFDNLRITKGKGRYTANFVPPAAPYPAQ